MKDAELEDETRLDRGALQELVDWYRKSAEQGYAYAQFRLGECYYKGKGVPEDKAEATNWYCKAAKQGHVEAQYKLGECNFKGEGTPKDEAEAMKWYHKAAEQGHTLAQFRLDGIELNEDYHSFDKGKIFFKNFACPYCKQKTIAIGRVFLDDIGAYVTFCANDKCITNYESPLPSEIEDNLRNNKELLRIPGPQKVEYVDGFIYGKHHLVKGIACPYCKKRTIGILETRTFIPITVKNTWHHTRSACKLYKTQTDEKQTQFQMQCVNKMCVTNNFLLDRTVKMIGMRLGEYRVSLEINRERQKRKGEKQMKKARLKNKILGGILGLAVADAVGVPVEFQSRESLRRNPVTEMTGYGTYNQPPGTWSDDTSLTLCLMESLTNKKIDYTDIMQRFLLWLDKGQYTAHGEVFDVGIATRKALHRFRKGTEPLKCGGTSEQDNGNGSLMRILPLAFYCKSTEDKAFMDIIHNVSSLTHAHTRSQIACGVYLIIARNLLDESDLKSIISSSLKKVKEYYGNKKEYAEDLKHYRRIFDTGFANLPEKEIKSSGYVVDTLEAALWCLLNTSNYKDCVLKAVNLGEDTDTVAAVAGGLAGMFYGVEGIPKKWLNQLARREYIEKLCEDFYDSLS